MQQLIMRNLQTKVHPETRILFWTLFASSRGGPMRIKIANLLRNRPYNTNQLSNELSLDYKGVQHHMNTLEKNNLVKRINVTYGALYFLSPLFEDNQLIFDEITTKLN